jgi:hypothetical protein
LPDWFKHNGERQPGLARGEGRLGRPGSARSLAEEDIVGLILDGTVIKTRLDRKATNISVLAAIFATCSRPCSFAFLA